MGEVFSQVVGEKHTVNTLLTQEICNLTYNDFLSFIGELNILAKKCLDSKGYKLVFAVKKDTDSTVFWKATVQIACVKIDSESQKVLTYRLLSLNEFLKVFKTFKCQILAAEQSTSASSSTSSLGDLTISTLLQDSLDSTDSPNECIICFERKQSVTLPCAHSYCTQCIAEWCELNNSCPICRERLKDPDDAWVISEVPNAEEIGNEIRENLLELSEERHSMCNPS